MDYARANNWTGEIVSPPDSDYLSIVDINLGALKSDRCIQRKIDYLIDFTSQKPIANLTTTYKNTCQEENFSAY